MLERQIRRPPRFFGLPPAFAEDVRKCDKLSRREPDLLKRMMLFMGPRVNIKNFYDSRHPSVYVIKDNKRMEVVDNFGCNVGFERQRLHFSSSSLFVDRDDSWVFSELNHEAFWRLGDIPQLGYLIAPHAKNQNFYRKQGVEIGFLMPQFSHTRWIHSLFVGALGDAILGRNGFTKEERAPMVLAFLCHDIAMPAGGDSIKRLDKNMLDEEINFAWVLRRYGLDKKWKEKYGFDLKQAAAWVQNKGAIGKLLDFCDKLDYTSRDCFYLGDQLNGKVRKYCLEKPLFADVWEDIRFTRDHSGFAFISAERLYDFLMARALEHLELLMNPEARIMDFYLGKLVKPLWERKIITKEQLLTWNNAQLEKVLSDFYCQKNILGPLFTPAEYRRRKFKTAKGMADFCSEHQVDHAEHLKGFKTGLDWDVFTDTTLGETDSLKNVLSPEKVQSLQDISDACRGFYAYWYEPLPD